MKNTPTTHRPALGLLLAAAALPFTPAFAQDTVPADPPVIDVTPPQPVVTSEPPTAPAPIINPAPVVVTPVAETAPVAAQTPAARTVARTPVRARAQAPARRVAPVRTVSAPAAAEPAPVSALPVAEVAPAPAPLPAAEPVAAAPAPVPAQDNGSPLWPWLLAGALLLAGAFAFFARRRRRDAVDVYDDAYQAPVATTEPVVPLAEPIAAAAPGRPWLELLMRPVRAGVGDEDAVVEFELIVDNRGSAAASDVRVSTWMLAAGSPEESEMERTLIDRPAGERQSEGTIEAGNGARIDGAVAMPRAGLSDAVLPVVVADARYRLPDGSEGRTSAAFAVGVADGADLAYFDVDHPSGMHEDVEARPRFTPQRV